MTGPTWWEHAFVALVVLFGVFAVFRGQPQAKAMEWDTAARISTYLANAAVLAALGGVTVLLWWLAGRPLADLGLRMGSYGPTAIVLTVLFVVVMVVETRFRISDERLPTTIAEFKRDTPFMPTTRKEFGVSTVLALSAGVNEELLFRGFLISYCLAYTGTSATGQLAAVAIPAIGFGLVHRYQTWRNVALIVWLSMVFGGIYLTTGSLLVPIVLHVGLDVIAAWLGVTIISATPEAPPAAA